MNDLRFAVRQLLKSPGFTVVAVLTLAFGIGVNSSIFGMVSAFFLQPLPVKDADRLVLIMQKSKTWNLPHGHSFPDFKDYRERTQSFSDLIAYLPNPVHLSAAGRTPERTWVELVTPNAFSALGVEAVLGRTLLPSDGEGRGGEPVVALSHSYWQNRFGGDPAIVGKTVALNGKPFTVVGVVREGYQSLSWAMAVGAFVPLGQTPYLMEGGDGMLDQRGAPVWRIMGKLKAGVTLSQARADVQVAAQQLAIEYPKEHEGAQVVVIPETSARPDPTFADFMPFFAVTFAGMVCLVLFIACANVANLMLSRAMARQRELVMRAALGAGRWQLMRQLLIESLVLAMVAGILGFFLGQAAGAALAGFTPQSDLPVNTDHPPDWRVYAFTGVLSLIAGVATGLVPALQASKFNLFDSLRAAGSAGATGGKHRLRNMLVVGQVTLSLVVLVCAGLFLHSLERVRHLDLGFRTENLLMMSLDLGLQGYSDDRGKGLHHDLLDRVRALPGVAGATLIQHVPFDYSIQIRDVFPENPPAQFKDGRAALTYTRIEHTGLKLLGTPLLRGRDFTADDGPNGLRVAIVNEAMATLCWPGQDPLGKRIRFSADGPWVEVVGIVRTGKYVFLAENPRPFYYVPLAQDYASPITLMVRASRDPNALLNPVREALRTLDPHLPVFNVRTLDEHMRQSVFALMPMRMGATMAGVQGLLGLLLAVMGLYAVVSYVVTQRTQEIGIRMALGAQVMDVVRLVVREGMRLTLVGVGIGALAAFGLAFALSRVLYGVSPFDVGVLIGVTTLLLSTAALACYIPARRATKVDPMVALRCE